MTTPSSASPTPSSDCTSESTNISFLAEPVKQCIRALEAAETDTEKFATLFLVPKLIKSPDCVDRISKFLLMKGIGYSFIARMLRSKDTPDGCPKLMYQSLALSILSCFIEEEEIMTHASILFNLPVLLDIINNADDDVYEDNLVVITDAYKCLTAIVSTEKGRRAFIGHRGVHYLCQIIVKQVFRWETAQSLLLTTIRLDASCWCYHSGDKDFTDIMTKLCDEFHHAQDETKFELCDTIKVMLKSYPKTRLDENDYDDAGFGSTWLPLLQRGLKDVFFSKIGKMQRDPAVQLVAAVVEVSDFNWCLCDNSDKDEEERGKFFMILLNLVCIEVIMHLDEQKLETVVATDSELMISCFHVIERAVGYLVNEDSSSSRHHAHITDAQKNQLYTALKNAFTSVVKFVQDIASETTDVNDIKERYFIYAVIRVLGAWLAEETMAIRDDVYSILHFILPFATQSFEAQKSEKLSALPGRENTEEFCEESILVSKLDTTTNVPPDTLRFLLPALCHLVTEEESRKIFVELKMHEVLFAYATYHWTIFNSYRHWVEDQVLAGDKIDVSKPPLFMIAHGKREMSDSKTALMTICNVFMNFCVLDPEMVNKSSTFYQILLFIITTLPTLSSDSESLCLIGNFSMLGLLILKYHIIRRPNESDLDLYKFVQSVVRFLWNAFNVEESQNGDELEISAEYFSQWRDLADLWYLGMQVLSSLLSELPWMAEFISESGWPLDIIKTLSKVRRGGIDDSTRSAYEDLLCQLLKTPVIGDETFEDLKKNQVVIVCQKHHMGSLANLISSKISEKSK